MVTRNHVHRFAYKLPQLLGENGTRIFLRLSAFIVLCIGVVVKKLRGIRFLRQVADQIALTIANVLAYTDISTSGTSSHISLRWADFHLCTPRAVRTSSGDRRFHAADSLNISCVGSHGRARHRHVSQGRRRQGLSNSRPGRIRSGVHAEKRRQAGVPLQMRLRLGSNRRTVQLR